MRYFQLDDDKELPGRWYLALPLTPDSQEFDPRVFTYLCDAGRPARHLCALTGERE